jgi:hypothetical protein
MGFNHCTNLEACLILQKLFLVQMTKDDKLMFFNQENNISDEIEEDLVSI